jgi:hypothetical protein
MAVAGSNCIIIATSGHYANITPFSLNFPTMNMVEIGDTAIAYDDPILHVTYLLVMQNVLLIPTMNHNLIPLFLVREAGLYVDETPKHQVANPTVDNHVCVCSRPPVEGSCPLMQYQPQGEFTPPNACNVIPPSDTPSASP